jgi:hypothetical protein
MQVAVNSKQRYKLKVFGHEIIYFILSSTKETQMCYTENGVIITLEFLIFKRAYTFSRDKVVCINLVSNIAL